jgi:hypothetical protein
MIYRGTEGLLKGGSGVKEVFSTRFLVFLKYTRKWLQNNNSRVPNLTTLSKGVEK